MPERSFDEPATADRPWDTTQLKRDCRPLEPPCHERSRVRSRRKVQPQSAAAGWLEALRAQTRQVDRIILVDNTSNDGTEKALIVHGSRG